MEKFVSIIILYGLWVFSKCLQYFALQVFVKYLNTLWFMENYFCYTEKNLKIMLARVGGFVNVAFL